MVAMKTKLCVLISALVAVCAAHAAPEALTLNVVMGDATTKTGTFANVRGYVDTVDVATASGSSTGTVAIAYVPIDTNVSAVNIATNAVTGSTTWRPRVDGTSIAGAALTSDPPGKYLLVGDALRMIISASSTGITWKATVKLDK